jgi:hypothetical protein
MRRTIKSPPADPGGEIRAAHAIGDIAAKVRRGRPSVRRGNPSATATATNQRRSALLAMSACVVAPSRRPTFTPNDETPARGTLLARMEETTGGAFPAATRIVEESAYSLIVRHDVVRTFETAR